MCCYVGCVVQGHPEYVECHLHAAKAEAAKGNLEAAIEAAKRALEAKADHPEALAMLGSLHMAATRWGEAHKSFKALRDLPADPSQVCRGEREYVCMCVSCVVAASTTSRVHPCAAAFVQAGRKGGGGIPSVWIRRVGNSLTGAAK